MGVEGYRPMETSFLSSMDDNMAISGQPHALTNDRMRVGTSSVDANVSSPLTDPLWFEGLDARVMKKAESPVINLGHKSCNVIRFCVDRIDRVE